MKRPVFILLLLLIAGRITGNILPLPSWLAFAAVVFLVVSQAWLFFKSQEHSLYPSGQILFLAVFILGVHQQRYLEERNAVTSQLAGFLSGFSQVKLTGKIARAQETQTRYGRLVVKDVVFHKDNRAIPLKMKALVYVYDKAYEKTRTFQPVHGDRVILRGEALIPPILKNPTLFNYRAFLAQRGIQLLFRLKSRHEIELSRPEKGRSIPNMVFGKIHQLRRAWIELLDNHLSQRDSALMKGLLLGRSGDMHPEDREMFLRTGLLHLFAVSGLHTGMIALLLFFVFSLLWLPFRLNSLLVIGGVWIFACLTGFRTPAVRAGIMISCLLATYWLPGLKRGIDGLSMLSFAAFWVLIIDPASLFQADFIFSYVSVFFIIVFTPFFESSLRLDLKRFHPRFRDWLALINRFLILPFSVVLCIQLALLPVLAFYYHRFSLIALIANPIALPIAFCCLILGILQMFPCSLFPGLLPFFSLLSFHLLSLLRQVVHFFSELPSAMIHMDPLPWYIIGMHYLVLLGGNWLLEEKERHPRRKVLFAAVLLGLITLLVYLPFFRKVKPPLEVVFLNVGQGDSIYIECRDGSNFLIDGGRHYPRDMGRFVIAPYLKRRGVDSLDAIIATHADADHIGGLPYILDHFFVDYLVEGPTESGSKIYREFEDKIESWGIVVKKAGCGDKFQGFCGAEIIFLSPPHPAPSDWSRNDLSLVLRLEKDDVAFLFTGDAEARAECFMLDSGHEIKANVLKAGHHGSRHSTSEAFLDAVCPSVAVISAGKGNIYGHPHPEVLERLRAHKVKIYRTDRDGAVVMKVKDGGLWIESRN